MALFAKILKFNPILWIKKLLIIEWIFTKLITVVSILFVKKIYYLILLKNIEEEILSLFDLKVSFSILLEL